MKRKVVEKLRPAFKGCVSIGKQPYDAHFYNYDVFENVNDRICLLKVVHDNYGGVLYVECEKRSEKKAAIYAGELASVFNSKYTIYSLEPDLIIITDGKKVHVTRDFSHNVMFNANALMKDFNFKGEITDITDDTEFVIEDAEGKKYKIPFELQISSNQKIDVLF